jgi:hypothetical protein
MNQRLTAKELAMLLSYLCAMKRQGFRVPERMTLAEALRWLERHPYPRARICRLVESALG